jgi:hypothetical protein
MAEKESTMRATGALAFAVALLTTVGLQAQEEARLPSDLWSQPPPVLPAPDPEDVAIREMQDDMPRGRASAKNDLTVNVAVHGRFVLPFGSADRDVFVYGGGVFLVDQHLSWADLFHPGWGFDVELDILPGDASGKGRARQPGFDYGGFAAVLIDECPGSSVSDGAGNFIHPQNLNMTTILVGGKVIQSFDQGFFADGRFGIGAVHYNTVEATFGGPGIPDFHDELLRDTWTFAMDLRGHGGIRLGPVGLTIGLGFRFMVPPNEGARVSLDSGPLWIFDIDIGAEIGF